MQQFYVHTQAVAHPAGQGGTVITAAINMDYWNRDSSAVPQNDKFLIDSSTALRSARNDRKDCGSEGNATARVLRQEGECPGGDCAEGRKLVFWYGMVIVQ